MTKCIVKGYEVEINKDGVKIGCDFFPRHILEDLLEEVDNFPKQAFPDVQYFNRTSDKNEVIQYVGEELDIIDFMKKSNHKEYEGKGFYLGDSDSKPWKVIRNSKGGQILILEEDEIK